MSFVASGWSSCVAIRDDCGFYLFNSISLFALLFMGLTVANVSATCFS